MHESESEGESESEVAQSCPTLRDPVDCSLPGSSVHGIFQARVLANLDNAGDPGSIPGSGRSPGEGIGYPLQYSWASFGAQLVKNWPVTLGSSVHGLLQARIWSGLPFPSAIRHS